MGLTFLTPAALLFALFAAVPVVVFLGRRRRAQQVRSALGLGDVPGRSWLALGASLAAVPLLVAVAAAQPVITSTRTVQQRSDVEVFVVVDTSRSMLASAGSGEPTRFERAVEDAIELQQQLREIPIGLASYTDRVLPHLFPTVDERVFRETAREALGIERPPPSTSFGTNVSDLDALGAVPTLAFFKPAVRERALVVFTDGESQPTETLASDFAAEPRVDVTFVRMGDASERIFEGGVSEAGYVPIANAADLLATAAAAVDGRVLEEGDVAEAAAPVRSALGTGPTRPRRIEGNRQALMPYVALLAALPLGFVLYRRNL